uniref:Uncharacterized protein n=1 Tax=Zea mays TaxID=4577 RepID=A0A804MY79_MAIZE
MVCDRARPAACPLPSQPAGRSDRRPPPWRSVHAAGAARDGGAAAAVGVGGRLRRAVGVVGPAALVARHLVRAQRRVADVPVGRLALRKRPPQRVAGADAAAAAQPELLLLVHAALAHGARTLAAALPRDAAAPRRHELHRAQVPDLGRGRHREERGRRRDSQQERQHGAGSEAGHVVQRVGWPCC